MKTQLLVDTRRRARCCRFIAYIVGQGRFREVRVTPLCPRCRVDLKLSLELAGYGDLPLLEEAHA